ncbi:MAG: hypothetical protein KF788_00290 [Piscinibacter sp.]|nr:hypothetical protein [Piscinibacter sp.]
MPGFRALTLPCAALLASLALPAAASPPLLRFDGAIGVDPLTAAGGVDTLNTVRGIAPGGRAWVLREFSATVTRRGEITARGRGLLFTSGEAIATRGGVASVALTLACGAADASATKYSSPIVALDAAGNFQVRGALSEDGVNDAVLPDSCDNPVLLVRAANATTGVLGGWFAAGIPDVER